MSFYVDLCVPERQGTLHLEALFRHMGFWDLNWDLPGDSKAASVIPHAPDLRLYHLRKIPVLLFWKPRCLANMMLARSNALLVSRCLLLCCFYHQHRILRCALLDRDHRLALRTMVV